MKKVILAVSLLVLILIFSSVVGGWFFLTSPVSKTKVAKIFVVPKGVTASYVAQKLESGGIIKSALVFKVYMKVTNGASKIKPGEFKLYTNDSMYKVIDALFGPPLEVWVTIPEGMRREQIVGKVMNGLEMPDSDRVAFLDSFLEETKGKEGYLFPDTYLFPPDITASMVTKKMLDTFDQKFDAEARQKAFSNGLDLNTVVTLASLVERETRNPEEKPVIAGIILKRMKAGWLLQIDATVQYAIASENCKLQNNNRSDDRENCVWWPDVFGDDLSITSPFNTYENIGFPPFPIANPGIDSLSASASPQDSPYWFYLHDTKGQIHYGATLEEHNENVSKYLDNN